MAVGVAVQAEPGAGTVVGIIAIVHGADDIGTGWDKMWSGKEKNTMTQKAAATTARVFGADQQTANDVGNVIDFAAGFAGGTPKSGTGLQFAMAGGGKCLKCC